MRERLESLGIKDWVERFDPASTTATRRSPRTCCSARRSARAFDIDNLAGNAYVRHVLRETGLDELLLRTGHKVAETMVELFSGLPPGHEFFAQYSFINQDDLPQFEAILKRVDDVGLKGLAEAESRALLALPFKLIAARHRLGLIDESFEARVIEARRYFAAHLPAELRDAVEFFDPARYNGAATLQDNILFGKIVTGQARRGGAHHASWCASCSTSCGLRPMVVRERPRLPGRRRRRAPRRGRPAEGGDGARAAQAPGAAGARPGRGGARPGVAEARGAKACSRAQGRRRWSGRCRATSTPSASRMVLVMERGTAGREGRVRRAEKENRMSLEQEVELIRQFPIFAKIQPAMQKLLCFSAERLTYAPGQVMFKAGDMGDAAYIVIEGAVEISVPTPSGPIVVNTLGRNDIIGEIAHLRRRAAHRDRDRAGPRSRRSRSRRSCSTRSSARTPTPRSS